MFRKNFQVLLCFMTSLCISGSACTQPALEFPKVQRVYFDEIDRIVVPYVKQEVSRRIDRFYSLEKRRRYESKDWILAGENALGEASPWMNKANLSLEQLKSQTQFNQETFNQIDEIIKQADIFLDQAERFWVKSKEYESELSREYKWFASKEWCAGFSSTLLFPEMPDYNIDENIDLSHIPQPKLKNMHTGIGSENQFADSVEKSAYLPMTTGGCMLGGAIGTVVPVLGNIVGCLIGSFAAAGIAHAGGRAASAVITTFDNYAEWQEYEQTKAWEQRIQQEDIQKSKQWARENRITRDVMRNRTTRFCESVNLPERVLDHDFEEMYANFTKKIDLAASTIRGFKDNWGKLFTAQWSQNTAQRMEHKRKELEEENQFCDAIAAYKDHYREQVYPILKKLKICVSSIQSCIQTDECINEATIQAQNNFDALDKWVTSENKDMPAITGPRSRFWANFTEISQNARQDCQKREVRGN